MLEKLKEIVIKFIWGRLEEKFYGNDDIEVEVWRIMRGIEDGKEGRVNSKGMVFIVFRVGLWGG